MFGNHINQNKFVRLKFDFTNGFAFTIIDNCIHGQHLEMEVKQQSLTLN